MKDILDLGHDHSLEFYCWKPDRHLNPQYSDVPDVERYGAIIDHGLPDGSRCRGHITFDGPIQRQHQSNRTFWQVHAWEPLTLSPSIGCRCGDHGFIREGKWVPA